MQIVGFGGLAKAGKTTAANILAEWAFTRGYHVVIEQFAGPLKKASAILGFHKGGDRDHLYREFCQTTGAFARKSSVDGDWFLGLMSDRLDVIAHEEQNRMAQDDDVFHESLVIIDDVRFPNECELLKKYRGRSVFICAHKRLTDLDAEWRKHSSEDLAWGYTRGLIDDGMFDFSVPNNKNSVVALVDDDGKETGEYKYPVLEAHISNLAPTLASLDAMERIHE